MAGMKMAWCKALHPTSLEAGFLQEDALEALKDSHLLKSGLNGSNLLSCPPLNQRQTRWITGSVWSFSFGPFEYLHHSTSHKVLVDALQVVTY